MLEKKLKLTLKKKDSDLIDNGFAFTKEPIKMR